MNDQLLEETEVNAQEMIVNLSSDQYDNFLRCLNNFRDVCNDVDIKGGIIRQRTNDKTAIFEVDMSPLISTMDITITDLKNKFDIFKVFSGQEVEIKIVNENEREGHFIISDQYSSITIKKPTADYIDNKFIPSDQLESIYSLDEETLLLEVDVHKMICDRIKTICQGLHTTSVQANFFGETSSLSVTTSSKDQHATFMKDLVLNQQLDNSFLNLTLITFVIDHDSDLKLKLYRNVERNITTNVFDTSLGDVKIRMFGNSQILEVE